MESSIIKTINSKLILYKSNQTAQAILVLFLALTIFFSPTIFTSKINSASDILQIYPTFKITSNFTPQNILFIDPMAQFEPWFKFGIDSLKSGSLPLWNPFQGNGTPHIANMQSAFFYPLTWLVFAFGFKYGLLLLYFFKLFFIGFFTYLFLKTIKIEHRASIIGSIAFMFCGFDIVWLYWPHTNVIFFLPLSLWLIERIFLGNDIKYFLFFSIGLAIALFAGHPETFAHIYLVAILYFIFKLYNWDNTIKNKLLYLVKFGTASLLGVLIASIQVIPFLEYLFNSYIYFLRCARNNFFIPHELLALNLIPDLFGNQAINQYYLSYASNYNESTSGYVGLTMLFFAALSFIYLFKDKTVLFFSTLALFSLAITYKAPIIFNIFTALPIFDKSINCRMLFIFAFAVSILGSKVLSTLFQSRLKLTIKRFSYLWITFIVFVAVLCLYSILYHYRSVDSFNSHLLLIKLIYIVDLALLVSLGLFLRKLKIFYLFLLLLIFSEVGIHGMIYEPATAKNLFFPKTPLITFLQHNLKNYRFASINIDGFLGTNIGTFYQIQDIRNYDAMVIKNYEQFLRNNADIDSCWPKIKSINPNYFNLSAVKYVIVSSREEFMRTSSISEADMLKYPVVFSDANCMVLENLSVFPKAFFVNKENIEDVNISVNFGLIQSNQVSIKEYAFSQVVIETENSDSGFLVLLDTFYPGWKTYVDGFEKGIKETASSSRAVYLTAGKHEVIFKYQPTSFRIGFFISLFSSILLIIGFFWTSDFFSNLRAIFRKGS